MIRLLIGALVGWAARAAYDDANQRITRGLESIGSWREIGPDYLGDEGDGHDPWKAGL